MTTDTKKRFYEILITLWGGGSLFSLFMIFPSSSLHKFIFISLAIIAALLYLIARGKVIDRKHIKKDIWDLVWPSLPVILFTILSLLFNYINYQLDEYNRSWFTCNLKYSGLEFSFDNKIYNTKANNTFKAKVKSIAKGKGVPEEHVAGCWFSLTNPDNSGTNCLYQFVSISIKCGEYANNWKLYRAVYIIDNNDNTTTWHSPQVCNGRIRYTHLIKTGCIKKSNSITIIIIAIRNINNIAEDNTLKYAINIDFID